MMRQVLAAATALTALPAAWEVAASALWANVTNRAFEPLGWWNALPYWHVDWWGKTLLIGSAAPPTVAAVLIAAVTWKLWRHDRSPSQLVYGKTEWANDAQMRKGGILTSKKPF